MVLFSRYEYNPQADLIGKGAFARVYRALDKELNTVVAIKIWKTGEALSAPFIPLADRQRLMGLSHPNICCYTAIEQLEKEDAFGETETIQVCVLELLDGGNLTQYYQSHKDPATLEKLLNDVESGLSYLHKSGVAHLDMKASNILIKETAQGPVAKIADFGTVNQSDIDEQSSYNSDFRSLASIVYELLTGDTILSADETEKFGNLPQPFRDLVYGYLSRNANKPAEQQVSTDDTQILTPKSQPVSSDDTQILSPKSQPASSDDTQILSPRSALPDDTQILTPKSQPVSSDDTQILSPKPQPASSDDTGTLSPKSTSPDDTQILTPKSPSVSSDDTQILSPKPQPASSDDTRILSPKSTSSDDTQILTPKSPSVSSDDTQILSPKSQPASSDDTRILSPKSTSPDDTQILTPKSPSVSSDDTRNLNPGPKTPPSDETQILRPRKEELLSLFNRYEYNPNTGLIGKGGFSRVYKAFDKKLNRWVALKIYKGGEFADRYSPIAEIRRVVNLDHPNICRYLDMEEIEKDNSFGEKEITQICVMELLDGGTFAQYYNANKNEKVLKSLLNDVLNGLSYLHKNGIVHRDIKPANILIKQTIDGPVAKITDFGISKASDSVNNNSSSALIVSIPYMAPEQLNVKKYGINEKISYNLDLWSLGVTIYEVVTGKVLFKNNEQDSSEQIMTNIMAPELPEKIRELPQPFRDIVSHCIVKNAKDRAQKAEELIVLLHGNYEEAPPPALPLLPLSNKGSVAESGTVPKSKTSFFIESGEEGEVAVKTGKSRSVKKNNVTDRPEVPINTKRKKRVVLIGLAAGFIVAFLAITFYFFSRENKNENLSAPAVKKTDPTTNVSVAPAKTSPQAPVQTPAQATADSTAQPSSPEKTSPPSGEAGFSARQPTTANAEKKPKRAAANENQEVPAAGNSNQKYVLLLTTTQSCTVKINQEDYGKLEAGKILKVFLVPGTYVIQATSLSNNTSVYNGNLEVTEKNRSQVGQYKIPLP